MRRSLKSWKKSLIKRFLDFTIVQGQQCWYPLLEAGKSFEPEHVRLQFFTIYLSVKSASFTDSYESAADMMSL